MYRLSLQVPLLERLGTAIDCTPSLTETLVLAPGGKALCSATLELTQDHIDGGTLSSVVFARAEASDGESVLGQDTVTQELGQAVRLSLGARGSKAAKPLWLRIGVRPRTRRGARFASM